MKILLIEPCFVGFGGYFRAHNISLALSKKGFKVDLLVSSNKRFKLGIKKTQINENFRQFELPRIDLNPWINFTGRTLRGIIGLIFCFKKRYDIYHAFVPTQLESNIPALFLKLLGKKIVVDWDDYWLSSPLFEGHSYTLRYLKFCEKRAPKFFENYTVVSEFLGKKAKEWGAKKILKIINGVNRDQFEARAKKESRERLGLEQNGKYLLAFGNNFGENRGFLLLKTFEKIFEIDSRVKLLLNLHPRQIVKDNQLEGKIDEKCFENVIDVGYISQKDLGYYLGACDAAVHLQAETGFQGVGYPVRIGSYINGEAVIIINDIDSEAVNTLKKFNCAVMAKNTTELAEKTVDYLHNADLQRELKNNILEAKKKLSWDNLVVDLIEFYKKV